MRNERTQAPLLKLSDTTSAFLEEATFGSKLGNKARVAKAKGQGMPNYPWIRCVKIDPVVTVNVPPAARTWTEPLVNCNNSGWSSQPAGTDIRESGGIGGILSQRHFSFQTSATKVHLILGHRYKDAVKYRVNSARF